MLFLTGCATKHYADNAIFNNVFKGDPSLSLGGNLELLAGNNKVETKNRDESLNKNDAYYLNRTNQYASQTGVNIAELTSVYASFKLIGGAMTLTNLLSNPGDYPDKSSVVFIKLNDNDIPTSSTMLQKAFITMTDPSSPLIQSTKCEMDGETLYCRSKGSRVGNMSFTHMVDFDFIKKINPHAKPGKYAAYGFEHAIFSMSILTYKDFAKNNPNVWDWFSSKIWTSQGAVHGQGLDITYRVTKINETGLKTAVYIHDPKFTANDGNVIDLR